MQIFIPKKQVLKNKGNLYVGRKKHTPWANIYKSDVHNIYYSRFLFHFVGQNAWKKRSLLSIHGDVTHPEKGNDGCQATGDS